MNHGYQHLIPPLLDAAYKAGSRILVDWTREKTVERKADDSPKTATDDAAEAIMKAAILSISDAPIVAEEAISKGEHVTIGPDNTFWLVDALDGTREFIRGAKDFTVNAALIENGQPILGIIHAPAFGITWYAAPGTGAMRIENGETKPIALRMFNHHALAVLAGKRSAAPETLDPFIGEHQIADRGQRSSSIKFCLVAEGGWDLYARLGETYEWDTASGDAILRAAGGVVLDLNTGERLAYGKAGAGFLNTGFIAGHPALLKGPSVKAR